MTIKAAYNFVPTGDKYYSPSWGNEVSQDVPFSDGISGDITLEIKANTAIFVKGNDGKFANLNKCEFIPGTTIKGCIRSVLEILSYGHLDETRVQNRIFALRDMSIGSSYLKKMSHDKIYCGWLIRDDNNARIEICGTPKYISYDDIYSDYGLYLKKKKNIFEKYKCLKNGYITDDFVKIDCKSEFYKKYKKQSVNINKIQGTIVFSGSIHKKKSDFIFPNNKIDEIANVDKSVLENFDRLYKEYKDKLANKYDKEDVKNMIIPLNKNKGFPVFFTYHKDKHLGNVIDTLGWVYMHKYFAANSVLMAIPSVLNENNAKKPDLADLIFGSSKYELKGRIQFGNAMKIKGDPLNIPMGIEKILGSPKASFYPAYLQDGKTWDSDNPLILGRKRYPIKPVYDVSRVDKSQVSCTLFPLKEGAVFECVVRFHNLRKIEIGSVLSAITFHGNEKDCKHSIGQAKAYGYGNVSILIKKANFTQANNNEVVQDDWKYYMKCFEEAMNIEKTNWILSQSIVELLAMARGISEDRIIDFTSLVLNDKPDPFRMARNEKKSLPPFSEIVKESCNHDTNYSLLLAENEINLQDAADSKELKNSMEQKIIANQACIVELTKEYFNEKEIYTAVYCGDKKAILKNTNKAVQCVIPKEMSEPKLQQEILVFVNQYKKDNTISQVKLTTRA